MSDLAQERRRDVATLVDWDGSDSSICVFELLVGSPLAGFSESQSLKQCDDLAGLEDRRLHRLSDGDGLNADELGLELGGAILK